MFTCEFFSPSQKLFLTAALNRFISRPGSCEPASVSLRVRVFEAERNFETLCDFETLISKKCFSDCLLYTSDAADE